MPPHTYFTVEEANAELPDLELRFTRIVQLQSRLREVERELVALGAPPTPVSLTREGGEPAVVRARLLFRGLVEALSEELSAIDGRGIAVKDIDIGLCDFLGRYDGRDVWLCWQFGEKQVTHWHELDRGFGQRQPLPEDATAIAAGITSRVLH